MKAARAGRSGDVGPAQWLAAFTLVVAAHLLVVDWLAGFEPAASAPAIVQWIEVSLLAPPAPALAAVDEVAPPELAEPAAPDGEPTREPVPEPEPQPMEWMQESRPAPSTAHPQRRTRSQAQRQQSTAVASRSGGGDGPTTVTDGAGEPATTPRHDPAYLRNPRPIYPSQARRRGFEGKVLIRAQVAASGECAGATVSRSSGHAVLDEAALTAVRQWRFVPASRGGRAVAADVEIPIVFRLED